MTVDQYCRHARQPRSDYIFLGVVEKQDFVEAKSCGSCDRLKGGSIRLAQAHFRGHENLLKWIESSGESPCPERLVGGVGI
jgi:hypothetical protein